MKSVKGFKPAQISASSVSVYIKTALSKMLTSGCAVNHNHLPSNHWGGNDSLWPRERFFPYISDKVFFELLKK